MLLCILYRAKAALTICLLSDSFHRSRHPHPPLDTGGWGGRLISAQCFPLALQLEPVLLQVQLLVQA
jgi:hypothetical protein